MTNQEFADKVNQAYFEAKKLLVEPGEYRIERKTARSISSFFEDAFAVYVANILKDETLEFKVDVEFRVKLTPDTKAIIFKPDLAIIKNKVVTHYFDMKTNLGFNRDVKNYLEKKNELVDNVKGKQIDNSEFKLSNNLKYEMVIFNGWNVGKAQVQKNIQTAKNLEFVEMYILRRAISSRETENDEAEFDRLKKSIKRNK